MRTTIFYSLVVIGITITLAFAGYIGTKANTAVAASAVSTVTLAHEPMQPVAQTINDTIEKAPTPSSETPVQPTSVPAQPASAPVQIQATPAPQAASNPVVPGTPVLLSIPSINLSAPVIQVGLNAKGEMDVPDGNTNNVGWYKNGPVPGTEGSAVLDAHVFAALKNLRYAKVGDSIYVKDAAGVTRHFVIRSSMVYELSSVPRELLFNRTGGKYLNIITCAGTFDSSINTYDHRLVVYAELVTD